jgi:hypothetical protein
VKIAERDFLRILGSLRKHGVLMETDSRLPSVAGLIAGEPIHGSWWAHPRAREIFVALNQLADHEDVLITKLVSRKVTLVHRSLWADFLAVASARESWQVKQLSPAAKFLLRMVDDTGWTRSDKVNCPKRFESVKLGHVARELEYKLLIHTEEFHTESGAHAKQLESWRHWVSRIGFDGEAGKSTHAKQALETLLVKLNDAYGAKGRLPWESVKI